MVGLSPAATQSCSNRRSRLGARCPSQNRLVLYRRRRFLFQLAPCRSAARDFGLCSWLRHSVARSDADGGLRAVFSSCGTRLWAAGCNPANQLRRHRIARKIPWIRFHGAALAAAGHMLAGRLNRLLVSSSLPPQRPGAWGSHWRTDRHWSSRWVEFAHVGPEFSRREKVLAIAQNPLVQQHLRVCWENRISEGNCSRCDKCLCAMALLEQCGQLAAFRVFDCSEPLAKRIDQLPYTRLPFTFRELLEYGIDRQLQLAVERLLQRSPDASIIGRAR